MDSNTIDNIIKSLMGKLANAEFRASQLEALLLCEKEKVNQLEQEIHKSKGVDK